MSDSRMFIGHQCLKVTNAHKLRMLIELITSFVGAQSFCGCVRFFNGLFVVGEWFIDIGRVTRQYSVDGFCSIGGFYVDRYKNNRCRK